MASSNISSEARMATKHGRGPTITILFLLGISAGSLSAQRPLHFDPWSNDRSWGLLLHNDRELIASNHVERMDHYLCHGGQKQRAKDRLVSTVTFNASGNPVYCQDRSTWSPCKQKPGDAGKKPFGKGLVGVIEHRFTYGEQGRLEQVSRVSWDAPFSRDEQDVRFIYDTEGRLTQEVIETRLIYKPGFKHRGTEYRNDTSVVRFSLAYTDGNRVRHLIRSTGPGISDTLHKDVPFDDLFPTWDDAGADTIEVPVMTGHAKLLGGACEPMLSDTVVRRHIHEGGRLMRTETVDRKTGAISDRHTVIYQQTGLYEGVSDENAACLWRMEYVLRE